MTERDREAAQLLAWRGAPADEGVRRNDLQCEIFALQRAGQLFAASTDFSWVERKHAGDRHGFEIAGQVVHQGAFKCGVGELTNSKSSHERILCDCLDQSLLAQNHPALWTAEQLITACRDNVEPLF